MLFAKFLFAALLIASPICFAQSANPAVDQPVSTPPSQSQSKAEPAIAGAGNQVIPQNSELPGLRSRTDLVLVPVVVTRSGKHVSGLQKAAFRVEENGKARGIAVFEEVQSDKISVPHENASLEGYSNIIPGAELKWRLTVVLLDMINTPWMRQVEAKRQLIDFLLRSTSSGEPIAIFGLNGSGLHQLHSFTTDSKILVGALQKMKLSLSSEEATQPPEVFTNDPSEEQQMLDEDQLMSDFMQDLNDTMVADYQRIATRQTLVGMRQLAHALEGIPGRKTLIWASAGFPFTIDDPQSFGRQGDDMQTQYQEAWRALNSSNIAVYPVDLSGMDFSARSLPSAHTGISSRQINNIQGTNGLKSALNLPYDKSLQQQLTLRSFAEATGGRACITVDELDRCFAEAVDDSRAYYLLGYYLGNETQPGWRKLKVKVESGGFQTQYRGGFYVAPTLSDSPDLRRQQLVEALASPVQYTGLRLTARLLQGPSSNARSPQGNESTGTVDFMLGVMGDSLTVNRQNGNAIDLEVISMVFDSRHQSVKTVAQSIVTQLKPESLEKTLRSGLGIPEKLEIGPSGREVKFAVRDNLSGRIGTVSVPVDLK